jgi:hypothetical protein
MAGVLVMPAVYHSRVMSVVTLFGSAPASLHLRVLGITRLDRGLMAMMMLMIFHRALSASLRFVLAMHPVVH